MAIKFDNENLVIEPLCLESLSKEAFCCGHPEVDNHFNDEAFRHMKQGYTRTFVACEQGNCEILGFYSFRMTCYTSKDHARHFGLAYGNGKPSKQLAAVDFSVPGFYIMFLGVKKELQHQGLGSFLMFDAIGRLEEYAKMVGGRFITILPNHEDPLTKQKLVDYYAQFNFKEASRWSSLMVYKLI